MNSLLSKILSVLFPPSCYNCHQEGTSLCTSCLSSCKKSIETPALYITSVYSFQDKLIKKVIHAIKYFHRRDLIEPLTQELGIILLQKLKKENITNLVIVPIPMSSLRKYMRGYNQAELIAKTLSQQCSLDINTKILLRKKSPKRQVTTKTRSERLLNQNDSFMVMKDVSGLNIILVDDVTTTGATIMEARKTLLKQGARSVSAITIAH